jgi:uncharacterized membrane protein YfcA
VEINILGFELLPLLGLLGVAVIGSIVGSLSGFGGGLIIIPFLVPVLGIKAVVPVITCAMIIGNGARVFVYREHIRADLVWKLSLSVVPGVVLGAFIYDRMPATLLSFFIGAFLILSVPLRWALRGRTIHANGAKHGAVGFGFGVITGSTPGAGVILVSILLGMGLTGGTLIGTDAVIGVLVSALRAALFGSFDLISAQIVLLGVLIGLATIPGAFFARWLMKRMPIRLHVAIIEVFVVGSGISIIWQGWRSATG